MRRFDFFRNTDDFQSIPAGQVIFVEDEPGDVMYVVIEGEIDITVQGKRLNHLTAGDIFGEMALIEEGPRSGTAVATTDCLVLPVNRDQFKTLVQQYPDFAIQVMTYMSARSRRVMVEELKLVRLQDELQIGREIQLSLLPEKCPTIPGWEFATFYRAARAVGGDLYDFIPSPANPHQLNIVIADVTGKGIPAALFMAVSRTLLRTETMNGHSPAETLRRTNRFIVQDSRSQLFLSTFYATLDTGNGRLTFANGGHERPLWLHHNSHLEPLTAAGLLLGVSPNIALADNEIELACGDYVLFFTDGVTDARNEQGQLFGEERLRETVAAGLGQRAQQLLEGIVTAVETFTGSTPQADDLTLIVVKREGESSKY